jgi:cytosine permease
MSASLPDYVASAKPNPLANRAPWHKTIAPTYAGVMLWFVFWQSLATAEKHAGGTLAAGLGTALLSILVAALICHFLFYYVPGLLGMKTGLPLYVVGTSTYGVVGGLILPGLVMGMLQFGWIGVNAYGVAALLCKGFGVSMTEGAVIFPIVNPVHAAIAIVFAAACAFMGLKGIQYVAKVATYLPLIPITVLVVLLVKTIGGLGNFTPETVASVGGTDPALSGMEILTLLTTVIVGFFATAGAAGTDIAMAGRNSKDVQLGGLVGIVLATIFAGGLAVIVVAGAYGGGLDPSKLPKDLNALNPLDLMKGGLLPKNLANIFMILLAISSFPGGCFSAFIAANSFKTTMPKVNPWVSVGLGTIVSIILAITGLSGKVIAVFGVIGASFGPVCGAMAADYLLSGRKWNGPRAGFNPAGWISWALGFFVGAVGLVANIEAVAKLAPALPQLAGKIPCPPVAAFVVGFVVYLVLAMIGLQSRTLEMPAEKAA